MKRVVDYMRGPALVIDEACSVGEARERLSTYGVRRMLVVDADGALIGLVRAVELSWVPASHCVRDCTSPDVVMCQPQDSIDSAREVMSDLRLRSLPVVVAGQVIGVLHWDDVERASLEPRSRAVREYV